MSAWYVTDELINHVIYATKMYSNTYTIQLEEDSEYVFDLDKQCDRNMIARELRLGNLRGLMYRYDNRLSQKEVYAEYTQPGRLVSTPQAVMFLQCLHYQSCDSPIHEESIAGKLIRWMLGELEARCAQLGLKVEANNLAWGYYEEKIQWAD